MTDEIVEGAPRPPSTKAELDDSMPEPNVALGGDGSSAAAAPTDEERWIALCAHVSGPLAWFLVPLILLLIQRDRRSFVAWHAREALNFNVSLILYLLLLTPVACLI